MSALSRTVRRRTADEGGFALMDVMMGVVVLALISGAVALTSGAVSSAITVQSTQADRWAYVTSAVNDGLANPGTVNTTTTTSPVTIAGTQVPASIVKDTSNTNRTIVRAAVPRTASYDCSNAVAATPAANDLKNCLVYEAESDNVARGQGYTPYTLTGVQAGVDGSTPVAVSTASPLASFTPPTNGTVNWVIGVVPGAGAGRVVIYQGTTVLAAQSFDGGTAGQYLYGTVPTTASATITINWEGGAGQAHHLLMYR